MLAAAVVVMGVMVTARVPDGSVNPMGDPYSTEKPDGPLSSTRGSQENIGESLSQVRRRRALEWVMGRQGREGGWGEDTAHTTLALVLTNASWILDPHDLEARLINTQFELQLVLRLWKHEQAPPTPGHLALNVLALVALCRDPQSFHGRDLVAMLERQEGAGSPFETAFSRLAACSAGRRPRRRHLRALLDLLQHEGIHSIDTLSVVVMALHCAEAHRHRDLSHHIDRAVSTLLSQQLPDGSFRSNLHTTALALQALIASGLGGSWNGTLAQEYLLSRQQPDGSFGRSLFDTNAVLPLLAGRTLLGASQQPCLRQAYPGEYPASWPGSSDSELERYNALREALPSGANFSAVPPGGHYESFQPFHGDVDNQLQPDVEQQAPSMTNFTYIIWIGSPPAVTYNMTMQVPKNTSFYEAMKLSAELDDRFEFSASHWGNGYYVHTLAGQRERMQGYWFWLLYRLNQPPVPGVKPDNKFVSPTGVMETIPNTGDYMLFWYHKI